MVVYGPRQGPCFTRESSQSPTRGVIQRVREPARLRAEKTS